MPLPALAGFEKSLVDSSGHGALCRVGPFGTESFRRPLRFTARKSAGIPSSAKVLWRTQSVPTFARSNPLRTFAETILMCLKPHPAQGERESARSEVRHAGADERLFESLPGPAIAISAT